MNLASQKYAVELHSEATGKAPTDIKLIPREGTITGRDGRSWVNDKPGAIVSAFNSAGVELPVDIEHSSQLKAPKGECAPAVGWIKMLIMNPYGEIWGTIEWTDLGRELIETKAYRYISPVFAYEMSSMRIIKLISVGLTNIPNLFLDALNQTEMPAFAMNSYAPAPVKSLLSPDEQKICDLTGVDPDAYIKVREQELQQARNSETITARRGFEMNDVTQSELKIAGMMGITPEEYHMARAKEAREVAINAMLTPEELKICNMCGTDPLDFLKTDGRLNVNTLLSQDEIATCRALNVEPLDFYFAKKYKC